MSLSRLVFSSNFLLSLCHRRDTTSIKIQFIFAILSAENFLIDFTSAASFYYLTPGNNSELEWKVYAPASLISFSATGRIEKMKKNLLNGVNTGAIQLIQFIMEIYVYMDYNKLLTKTMVLVSTIQHRIVRR